MTSIRGRHQRFLGPITLGLVLTATMGTAAGQQTQSQDPINLEADKAELNNATGESVYTGDVKLTRGETVITGDRLELYTNDDGALERAVVTGEPATYKGKPQPDEGIVRGEAPRMIYYAGANERIRMTNGAVLWRDKDRLEGQTVVYRIQDDTVEAESGQGSDQRINITLQPESSEDGE
jgi:lipopolysaccharide export system protein LptA